MKMKNFTFYFVVFSLIIFNQTNLAQKQIVINELSHGPHWDWEWIEYLITEDNTDIRGVYLDDDDLPPGPIGSTIMVQLKKDLPIFENVNKGSLIVIYKSTDSTVINGQDPKLYEAGAPDTDFSDGVIIIPHTNTEFLEPASWWPQFRADGENVGIFDSLGIGIFGISYGDHLPTGHFNNGWGMANLLAIPFHGVGFYTGTLASTAFDSTLWFMGISTIGTPGALNWGQGTIPVELVSFSAGYINDGITLQWTTATELNNYGFDIERSNNMIDWQKVGFVKGSGNSTELITYKFIDSDTEFKSAYYYRLKQIDFDGSFVFSNIVEINPLLVESFILEQNYPNPFNPATTIKFSLPNIEFVSLNIYSALGEKLETLHEGILDAGIYTFNFNAENLPSGMYIYKLNVASSNVQIKKMMLIK
jgi:hypothetical protein